MPTERRSVEVEVSAKVVSTVAGFDAIAASAEKAATAADKAGRSVEQANAKGRDRSLSTWFSAQGASAAKAATLVAKNREQVERLATTSVFLGAAVTAAVGVGVYKMAQFDASMSKVAATGDDARNSLQNLRAAAITAGQDTKYSATDAADGVTNLAKAGMSAQNILRGGLVGSLNLAAAGELSVADAAETTATALVQFGLDGTQATHVADLLAAGAGKAQGEVSDLAYALKYVGPVTAGMNVSLEETVGALAAFANQGLIGEQAGTSLRGVLMSLTSPSSQARKEMQQLGIQLYDSNGKFVGLSNVAGQLSKAYTGMNDAQRNASLGIIFGNAQVTAARVLFASGAEGIQAWTDRVNDAGYAARAAALLMDNLNGDVEQLSGSIETAAIQSGSSLNSFLRRTVQGTTGAVNALSNVPEPVIDLTVRLAALAGAGLLVGGGLLKAASAASEAYTAWKTLGTENAVLQGKLSKTAAVAGKIAIAFAALQVIQVIGGQIQANMDKAAGAGNQFVDVLLDINKQSNVLTTDQTKAWGDLGAYMNNMANWHLSRWLWDTSASLVGMKGYSAMLTEQFGKLDTAYQSLGQEKAAPALAAITAQLQQQGVTADELVRLMPSTTGALQSTAQQLGVTGLSAQDYVDWMGGKIPAAVAEATAAHPELVAGLDDTAHAAATGTTSLQDLVKALYDAADAQLALSGSQVGFERGIDQSKTAAAALVKKAKKDGKLGDLSNIDTAAGQQGIEILNRLATSTNTWTKSMILNKASQEDVRLTVARARTEFIAEATAMGYSADEAAALADARGLIPENITLQTADEGTAAVKKRTDALADAIKGLPKKAQTKVQSEFDRGGISAAYTALAGIDGKAADAFINSILDKGGINDWNTYDPKNKTAFIDTVIRTKDGRKLTAKAYGGPVWGAGTETSDSIPALLSNNEHVWTAAEVRGAGGHSAVERMRGMARAGVLPAFAKGGAAKKKKAKEQANARKDLLDQLRKDVRRSTIADDVASGSGLSVIDDLLSWSKDTNLGKGARKGLAAAAAAYEAQLTGLYKQLADANKTLDKLQATYDSVVGDLNTFDMGAALQTTYAKNTDTKGNTWYTETPGDSSSVAAAAEARATQLRTFAGKLSDLQKAGASAAVMAAVAKLGPEQGIGVADSFLANRDNLTRTNQAYTDIETYSKAAGQAVTEASYAGGLAAAQGMVDGLDKQIAGVGGAIADAFAKALGYKVVDGQLQKRAKGGSVAAGVPYQVLEDGIPEVLVPGRGGAILNMAQAQAALRDAMPMQTMTQAHVDAIVGAIRAQQTGGISVGSILPRTPHEERALDTLAEMARRAGR